MRTSEICLWESPFVSKCCLGHLPSPLFNNSSLFNHLSLWIHSWHISSSWFVNYDESQQHDWQQRCGSTTFHFWFINTAVPSLQAQSFWASVSRFYTITLLVFTAGTAAIDSHHAMVSALIIKWVTWDFDKQNMRNKPYPLFYTPSNMLQMIPKHYSVTSEK